MAILEYLNVGGTNYSVFHAPFPVDGVKTVWNNQTHSNVSPGSSTVLNEERAFGVTYSNCIDNLCSQAGFTNYLCYLPTTIYNVSPFSVVPCVASVLDNDVGYHFSRFASKSINYCFGLILAPQGYGYLYRNSQYNVTSISQGAVNSLYNLKCNFSFTYYKFNGLQQ